MTINNATHLNPEIVLRLKRLDWIARLVVEGFITGMHRSPYHGFSVEFSEHRPYLPGDPIRDLDWKAYAKSDRLYTKKYEEETNLKAYMLLDLSGSMAFSGDGSVSKYFYASALASALAHLMLRQRDAVGLALFRDGIDKFIPPRSTPNHLSTILQAIDISKPSLDTNIASTFHDIADRIPRRALVIVLSDLLDDPMEVLDGLRHFRHKGHEIVVFQILDPCEINLKIEGETCFKALEDPKQRLTAHPREIQREYSLMMVELLDKYRRNCMDAGIDYNQLVTTTPFDIALSSYIAKRKKLS
mgnify:FL=1